MPALDEEDSYVVYQGDFRDHHGIPVPFQQWQLGLDDDDAPGPAPGSPVPLYPPGPQYPSDLAFLAEYVAASLIQAGVYGFSLVARQNGKVIPGGELNYGFAQGSDGDTQRWTPDVRMVVGSISKVVTAMALLQILYTNDMTPGAPIRDWLPPYWLTALNKPAAASLAQLRFSDLLRHQTGFNCALAAVDPNSTRTPFQRCRLAVQSGAIQLSQIGSYNPGAPSCYENANYEILRVIVAALIGDTAHLKSSSDDEWDSTTSSSYEKYTNAYIFAPSGVAPAESTYDDASAHGYLQDSGYPGAWTPNTTSQVGAGGWYLSPNDVLKVAGAFRREGLLTFVSANSPVPDPSQWLFPGNVLTQLYGVDTAISISSDPTTNYTYFSKNGSIPVPVYGLSGLEDFYTSVSSYLWFLPNEVEIVLLINSRVGPLSFPPLSEATDLGAYDPRGLMNDAILRFFPAGTGWSSLPAGGVCCGPPHVYGLPKPPVR